MSDPGFSTTPSPPYFAVIFTSRRSEMHSGYHETAQRMVELARGQPGFLGVESTRDEHGLGITVSYWQDEASILHWRENAEHRLAQALGRRDWYVDYLVRIARVERCYGGTNRRQSTMPQ